MRALAALMLVLLAACSDPAPPVGKWEGGYEAGGTIVVARVEIVPGGQVKISAPDLLNIQDTRPEQMQRHRERLIAELRNNWSDVAPRPFDFDGRVFRKPDGVAPQMIWDEKSGQMTLQLYFGANPALPVVLRQVDEFNDSPFARG